MTTLRVGRVHYAWVVLGGTAIALLAASGVRSAFGVFIKPMEAEFGWDRTALSLVASLSFVFNGAAGPLVGRLADRWGGRVVLVGSQRVCSGRCRARLSRERRHRELRRLLEAALRLVEPGPSR